MDGGSNVTTYAGNETATPYSQRPETYLVPIVFLFIFIVGVLGNGTLVVIFLRHRAMRNVPNTYIFSLALADLLVIVTCVPFTSVVYTLDSWPWGEAVCKLSETVKDVSIGVSVFTLTALSADRFFAIVDPLRKLHATGGGRRATCLTVSTAAAIWVISAACAVPSAVGAHLMWVTDGPPVPFCVCYPFPERWGLAYKKANVLAKFLVFYSVPLVIIGIFYALMARHLIISARNVPGELQGAHRQVRVRKKVAWTVLTFVLVFAVCFLPSHLFMLWFYLTFPSSDDNYNSFWHYCRIVGFCLVYMNSCVNPVALYCVSGTFRKHFDRYLLCRGKTATRSRCNTCKGQRTVSMSLTASRRQHSGRARSTIRGRPADTSVTALGNGNEQHACSNM